YCLYAIILHPSFPDDELTKMRRLLLTAVERQNDDWHTEIERLWRQLFFPVSPYRLSPEGTVEALQRLQRQGVVAFAQRYVVPDNMVLAIVGDIAPARTVTIVEQTFNAFLARPVTFPEVPAEPLATQVRRQVKQTQKQVAAISFPGT